MSPDPRRPVTWNGLMPLLPRNEPPDASSRGSSPSPGPAATPSRNRRLHISNPSSPLPSLVEPDVYAPAISYCHSLRLPLYLGPPPDEPYVLEICIHPDWTPLPHTALHLTRDTADVSCTSMHSPPLVRVGYEPVDLWGNHVENAQTPASSGDSQRSPSPPLGSPPPLEAQPQTPPKVSVPAEAEPSPRLVARTAQASSPRLGFWSPLLALVAVLIACLASSSHPAWVMTSTVNQTDSFHLWQPAHLICRDYENVLLPLVTELELREPVPQNPRSTLAALAEELVSLLSDLYAWDGSPLPGPGQPLMDRVDFCIKELNVIQHSFKSLFTGADPLIRSSSTFFLADALINIELKANSTAEAKQDAIERVIRFWSTMEDRNGHALLHIQRISKRLRTVRSEFDPILVEIVDGLAPHANNPRYKWIARSFDAVNYSRNSLVEAGFQIIPQLVDRAAATLSTIDSTVAAQLEFWRTMAVSGGVGRETVARFITDDPRWYSSWVLEYQEVTTHYTFDNRTVIELIKVGERGHLASKLVKANYDNRTYLEIRPKRPPLR
ncbi:hypothetical protein FZEAL_8098 [Fusarium zealandicum]|uniref:Uncharacterized protein n=1 Tax=Fusarium zealandicum TaxID=1053134 RepID=A0A8H4UEI6_9HYPO|nr:hypothetical protein FZEAL_8098 [Fusarium zealandicum]